jgi:hypothetical protein
MLFTIDDPFDEEEQLTKQQQEQLEILDHLTENIREGILSGHITDLNYEANTVASERVGNSVMKAISPQYTVHKLMWRKE